VGERGQRLTAIRPTAGVVISRRAPVATMAVVAPVAAAVTAGILLAIGIVALVMLWTRVRRGWIRFRDWRGRRAAPV
jgi:hypothetical protein